MLLCDVRSSSGSWHKWGGSAARQAVFQGISTQQIYCWTPFVNRLGLAIVRAPIQWRNPPARLGTLFMKLWDIQVAGDSSLLSGLLLSWTCFMEACFCCFSAPAIKTTFQKSIRIWHIDPVCKFLAWKVFCAQRTVFETVTSKNCNIGGFYFVAQVVAKLNMLYGGLLLLFQCALTETKLQKKWAFPL